jgi:hypothetical protein
LVIVTDDSVPPAAVTLIGATGLTPCAPLAGLLLIRAGGAAGELLVAVVLSPDGVELPTGGVLRALCCPDVHAPSANTTVAAAAATDQSRRSPTNTPTSGLQFPTINRVELNCGPEGRIDAPADGHDQLSLV